MEAIEREGEAKLRAYDRMLDRGASEGALRAKEKELMRLEDRYNREREKSRR